MPSIKFFTKSISAEEESKVIARNAKTERAQRPHRFRRAQRTSGNGHPRCLTCGDEPGETDMCSGLRKDRQDVKKSILRRGEPFHYEPGGSPSNPGGRRHAVPGTGAPDGLEELPPEIGATVVGQIAGETPDRADPMVWATARQPLAGPPDPGRDKDHYKAVHRGVMDAAWKHLADKGKASGHDPSYGLEEAKRDVYPHLEELEKLLGEGALGKSFGNSLNQTAQPKPPGQPVQSAGQSRPQAPQYFPKPSGHEDHVDALQRVHSQLGSALNTPGVDHDELAKQALDHLDQHNLIPYYEFDEEEYPEDIHKRVEDKIYFSKQKFNNILDDAFRPFSSKTKYGDKSTFDERVGLNPDNSDSPIEKLRKRTSMFDGRVLDADSYKRALDTIHLNPVHFATQALKKLGETGAYRFMDEAGFSGHEAAEHLLEAQRRLKARDGITKAICFTLKSTPSKS